MRPAHFFYASPPARPRPPPPPAAAEGVEEGEIEAGANPWIQVPKEADQETGPAHARNTAWYKGEPFVRAGGVAGVAHQITSIGFTVWAPTEEEDGAELDIMAQYRKLDERMCELRDKLGDKCKYLLVGYESADSKTTHCHGYLEFKSKQRLTVLAPLPSYTYIFKVKAHLKYMDYIRKDETALLDLEGKKLVFEVGKFVAATPGARTDISYFADAMKAYCEEHGREAVWDRFLTPDVVMAHAGVLAKYETSLKSMFHRFIPRPERTVIAYESLRPWQKKFAETLSGPPDDRSIHVVIDFKGGAGKSKFIEYWMEQHPATTCVIKAGVEHIRDAAMIIQPSVRVLFFDFGRAAGPNMLKPMCALAESVKDKAISWAKYQSTTVALGDCHVVLMLNDDPSFEGMLSLDRIKRLEVAAPLKAELHMPGPIRVPCGSPRPAKRGQLLPDSAQRAVRRKAAFVTVTTATCPHYEAGVCEECLADREIAALEE